MREYVQTKQKKKEKKEENTAAYTLKGYDEGYKCGRKFRVFLVCSRLGSYEFFTT